MTCTDVTWMFLTISGRCLSLGIPNYRQCMVDVVFLSYGKLNMHKSMWVCTLHMLRIEFIMHNLLMGTKIFIMPPNDEQVIFSIMDVGIGN